MPIYTQYLTTLANPGWNNGTPINTSSLNSVKWSLNWDDIFRMDNYKYKHCRVRIKLNTQSFTSDTTDWEVYQGYLTCNLQGYGGYSPYGGALLGMVEPTHPSSGSSGSNGKHCIIVDTTEQPGVDVIPPKGNQEFIINFNKMDLSKQFITTIYDYQCILYFELYD